ncbi:MAG: hypothetical protein M3135_06720 [Actinomycetota bacterium]|nr:hypothetical protein [Actinomycetota bacterium]
MNGPMRVAAVALAVIASALQIAAALMPEFVAGGVIEAVPLDQERPGALSVLVALLVHVGVLLVAALMMVVREAPGVAGGLLIGASAVGASLRAARLFQLAEAPQFAPAIGSWMDLGAEVAALTAGIVALLSTRGGATADAPGSRSPSREPQADMQ